MKVCCFYSTLPSKTLASPRKHDHKIDTFRYFYRGVKAVGDEPVMVETLQYEPCDIAFMLGWVHEFSKDAPHLQLRKEIIDRQAQSGGRVVVADSNLFLFSDMANPRNYQRYSFDGVFPDTGEYCDQNPDPARWPLLQQHMNIPLQPWRQQGDHVVVSLQRDGGWSMNGMRVEDWCTDTVIKLRALTDRPIRIRAHPGDKKSNRYVARITHSLHKRGIRQYFISDAGVTLRQDLDNAWALVNHNSSPAVAAAVMGVPVFSTDIHRSQAREVSHSGLAQIESPDFPDRTRWLHRLAQSHWSHEDLALGHCWRHMRNWVTQS